MTRPNKSNNMSIGRRSIPDGEVDAPRYSCDRNLATSPGATIVPFFVGVFPNLVIVPFVIA